jgi:cytochrome c oxidase assembly protein subunit 15
MQQGLNLKWRSLWLSALAVLTILMIGVGGITRLTRSGLSIVEWKPVSGIILPLNEGEWLSQFELYQKSPEFQKVNSNFGLADYKKIFMWEYLHRVLGRLIFLFVLIPGIYLWRRKFVEIQLVILLASLVAAQGLVGWLMVKSGLNNEPHVSPFFLALHFFSALVVLLTIHYNSAKLKKQSPTHLNKGQRGLLLALGLALVVQVFYGCLTSGFKAGFMFNTYPLMNGDFFPAGGIALSPYIVNFFENPTMIQWVHRWLGATVLVLTILSMWNILKTKGNSNLKGPMIHLAGIISIQVVLGILNIVLVVPIPLAVIHQITAALILTAYFDLWLRTRKNILIHS